MGIALDVLGGCEGVSLSVLSVYVCRQCARRNWQFHEHSCAGKNFLTKDWHSQRFI